MKNKKLDLKKIKVAKLNKNQSEIIKGGIDANTGLFRNTNNCNTAFICYLSNPCGASETCETNVFACHLVYKR